MIQTLRSLSVSTRPGTVVRNSGPDTERMNRPGQFLGKDIVNHALPHDTAVPGKATGKDDDTKMRFALRTRPDMASM